MIPSPGHTITIQLIRVRAYTHTHEALSQFAGRRRYLNGIIILADDQRAETPRVAITPISAVLTIEIKLRVNLHYSLSPVYSLS